jgi:hypothetical protein
MYTPNVGATRDIVEKLIKAEHWYKGIPVPTDPKKLKDLQEWEGDILQALYNDTQYSRMQVKGYIRNLQQDLEFLDKLSIVTKDKKQRSIPGLGWVTGSKMAKRF